MTGNSGPTPYVGDNDLARALTGAMNDFASARSPRVFSADRMIRKARRRTALIATSAAAAVLLVSGGAFAATLVAKGPTRGTVPGIGTSVSGSPSAPSSSASSTGPSTPSDGPAQTALSAADADRVSAVVSTVYGKFEQATTPNASADLAHIADSFVSHAAYLAVWGSGKAKSAPLACGTAFRGSVVGTPARQSGKVYVPVTLLDVAKSAPRQPVLIVDATTAKISGVTCRGAVSDVVATAAQRDARNLLVSFYGPYVTGSVSQANGLNRAKYFTSSFVAGPRGNASMVQFNSATCMQDGAGVWVVGAIDVNGHTATAAVTFADAVRTVTIDLNARRISFVDCVPMPAQPRPTGTTSTDQDHAQALLNNFFESYEVAWGWRAIRPVKPMIAGYFSTGAALDGSWSSARGLMPKGCDSTAPYVDAYISGGSPHVTGAKAAFGLDLFDTDGNQVGAGSITVDLKTMKITGLGC